MHNDQNHHLDEQHFRSFFLFWSLFNIDCESSERAGRVRQRLCGAAIMLIRKRGEEVQSLLDKSLQDD